MKSAFFTAGLDSPGTTPLSYFFRAFTPRNEKMAKGGSGVEESTRVKNH